MTGKILAEDSFEPWPPTPPLDRAAAAHAKSAAVIDHATASLRTTERSLP